MSVNLGTNEQIKWALYLVWGTFSWNITQVRRHIDVNMAGVHLYFHNFVPIEVQKF